MVVLHYTGEMAKNEYWVCVQHVRKVLSFLSLHYNNTDTQVVFFFFFVLSGTRALSAVLVSNTGMTEALDNFWPFQGWVPNTC